VQGENGDRDAWLSRQGDNAAQIDAHHVRVEWFGAELPGADPIGKGTFGSSFNNVHVLRLEAKTLKLQELR
jgi:hypothetical protein